jgi:prolyl oligopeptidase
LRARLAELSRQSEVRTPATAGGRIFWLASGADDDVPKLITRDGDGRDRVLVDPATHGQGGAHAAIGAYAPSPDGARVAYSLDLGGGEIAAIHVVDVATGKDLADVVERTWGDLTVTWLPDGTGFFYIQFAEPKPGVDPLVGGVDRLHVIGTAPDQDPVVVGGTSSSTYQVAPKEFPLVTAVTDGWVIAVAADVRSEGRWAIAPLAKLDRSGAGKTPWRVVTDYPDAVEGALAHGDRLYLLTFEHAPNRKVISVPLADPVLAKARVEVPESTDASIQEMAAAQDGLYVRSLSSGLARLTRLRWRSKSPHAIALPIDGTIEKLATDPLRDGVFVSIEGWTQPRMFLAVDVHEHVLPTGIVGASSADLSGLVAEELEVTSADGTKVPMSLVHRKELPRDGSSPTIVDGYGAYGVSLTPQFQPQQLAWLEHGGVDAICHVRGGGEKGRRWQDAGSHEHKMNGIHDLEACGQYLIDQKITTSARLFATGGSMGGILVGRTITDRPDLFAGAAIFVGEDNPLRIMAAENGVSQLSELGDPSTEAGFQSILAYDPYQHVTPGTAYPAVLLPIGLNDRRVAPWMTGKMAAKMQASSTSGRPILIRIDEDAGHGMGSTRDQQVDEAADVLSFFLSISASR